MRSRAGFSHAGADQTGALVRYALLWSGGSVLVVLVALGWFRAPDDRRDPVGGHPAPAGVVAAAHAADCSFRRLDGATGDPPDRPPAVGDPRAIPAPDGAYEQSPPVGALRGALARGRVVIQYSPALIAGERGQLERLYDGDRRALILTPDRTGMHAAVAATARRRVLECPGVNKPVLAALGEFRDRFRGGVP
jgi:Protein of unknown function (DUF3105)